jgi:hypothetical protein
MKEAGQYKQFLNKTLIKMTFCSAYIERERDNNLYFNNQLSGDVVQSAIVIYSY